jgi:CRP/FNR family cyclic AMP-dependent transcriptional regulator
VLRCETLLEGLQLIESEGVVTREGYKIPTRYTHGQLATMIGSKRETVTKAFTLLQRAGVVELKRRRIHVKDIEALRRAARQEPLQRPVL